MRKSRHLLSTIVESLKGGEHDFTSGSLRRAIVLLAVPMILELSLESVFAVVDIFFVSKLGKNAIATVGLSESMITIVYSVAIGLGTAATAIVARRTGEKNSDGAAHAGAQAILAGVVIAILLGLLGVYFAADLLALMGADAIVIRDGAIYTRILFASSLPIALLFIINGIFRGAGNAAMAMRSLWLASILNIILCPILIHFFGLKGAAIATATGRTAGVFYQVYFLVRPGAGLRLKTSHFKLDPAILKSVIAIASPATLQFIIASGSWIVMTRLVAESEGTTASAGYQIAIRNVVFFIMPAWGLSNAAATLVGQNLGAKQVKRAEDSVMLTTRYNAVFMGTVMLLFLFFAGPIIGIFTQDSAIAAYGIKALRIIGSGYIFYGIGMVMVQALNGAGDTKTPTIINLICFWVFQIPFAYLLARGLNLNATGAFIAIPVAESLIALFAWYYFRKGNWKTVKV